MQITSDQLANAFTPALNRIAQQNAKLGAAAKYVTASNTTGSNVVQQALRQNDTTLKKFGADQLKQNLVSLSQMLQSGLTTKGTATEATRLAGEIVRNVGVVTKRGSGSTSDSSLVDSSLLAGGGSTQLTNGLSGKRSDLFGLAKGAIERVASFVATTEAKTGSTLTAERQSLNAINENFKSIRTTGSTYNFTV